MIPIQTLARICLFVAKPQDLPASRQTLVFTIASAVVVLFICYTALSGDQQVILLSIAHIVAMGLAWTILLKFRNRLSRWYQSATAIYGCTSLINLAQLPMVLQLTKQTNGGLSQPSAFTALIVLLMWVWEISVMSNIVRQTLEVRRHSAVAISLIFTVAIHFALLQLFGHARA